MHRLPRAARLFTAVLLGLAVCLPAGSAPANVAPAAAAHLTPTSVTIAGSLQSELGCAGDWDAACAATYLTYSAANDVWTQAFNVPAGSWEYKAPLNDSWAVNYGRNGLQDGPNIALNLAAPASVKFYYDNKSHWVTDNRSSRIVTAPGSYQSEVGCAGDWQPECLRTWLQDVDGDGTYTWSSDSIPVGNHEVKAAVNESWGENYGAGGAPDGANIPFSVAQAGSTVAFSFVSSTNTLSVSVTPPSGGGGGGGGGGGAGHDNDVWWNDLGHDSRDPLYRTPTGAVPTGTPVTLRLRSASGDLTQARVRVWNDRSDSQSLLNMTRVADDGTHEWWQATLPASSVPTIYWYRFIAIDGSATAYYEDDARRTGGWGETFGSSADNSWQLTVYDPSFSTPDWVKNAVIYQIFPDRFRNGDASNDPAAGEFFYGETPTVYRSHGSAWNTPICDPRAAGGACPNVYSQNFYGGDLAGIVDKLDYLDNLGITALYLNPIFESPSNHKYDTTDFSQIDPSFGDQALFQTLAAEAHARGIRLILDGVFNHTSSDSLYFDRYGRHATDGACESATSPYRDWYHFTSVTPGLGDCVGDDGTPLAANYESWFGYDSLPKLNSANAEVRDFFYAGSVNPIGPYWLSWADGWRLDVGGDVDPGLTNNPGNDYWEGFRAAVRAANPDAYIVGEEWGMATPWTLGAEWDATMNYQLSSALLSFYRDELFVDNDHNTGSSAGTLSPLTPTQLAERLLNLQERYPPEAFYALMNLLGSHDTNRALFMLDHNADLNNRSLYESPSYDWSDAIARLKGVALLQATLPGAPTIYYGDEVGLVAPPTYDGSTWQDDPYNRIPYPWLDESGTPFYAHLQAGGAGHTDLLPYYTLLLGTRNDHPALRTGSLDILHADDASDTFAYGRKLADQSDAALVLVNRSPSAELVELDLAGYLPVGAQLDDALGGGTYTVDGSGGLSVNLPPGSGALLVLSAPMAPAPATVTDLAVSGERSTEIDLDWSAAAGASSYDVYRSAVSGGGYTLVGSTAATEFTDAGLPTASTWYYVVVARDDATLLQSGRSNEATGTTGHDLGDGTTSWFNLQWPPSMTHTLSTTDRTDTVYAQIWVSGVTEAPGQAPGIRAQVGFGPDGSQPGAGWTWSEMTFNTQAGNNDEYMGDMLPTTTGEFDYAVRWSGDGGTTWYLADLNGPERDGTLDSPGALTVVAGSDTNAPSAPVLSLDGVTASSVSLSWTASTDDVAVAGYELLRDGDEIAELGDSTTSYVDESVTTGQTYTYVVRAFDTGFNRSPDSNAVEATAENRMVDVTFRVGVPGFTPADAGIYVTGSISELGPFNPSAFPMTEAAPGVWERTFSIADGTSFEWKYTRGSWDTVEQWDSISGLANRGPVTVDYGTNGTMLIDNTGTNWGTGPDSEKAVRQWRDPLVTGHSPADGATDVSVDTTVVVEWSKPMSSATDFAVEGSDGIVAGTFALSNGGHTVTFTPSSPLAHATAYEVTVSGETSAGGDAQQVAVAFDFTTEAAPPVVLESVVVTPIDPQLKNGKKLQLTATAHYSDGSSIDVTDEATWTSSDRKVVFVSEGGQAHARKHGSAVISATFDGETGQTTVTVPFPR